MEYTRAVDAHWEVLSRKKPRCNHRSFNQHTARKFILHLPSVVSNASTFVHILLWSLRYGTRWLFSCFADGRSDTVTHSLLFVAFLCSLSFRSCMTAPRVSPWVPAATRTRVGVLSEDVAEGKHSFFVTSSTPSSLATDHRRLLAWKKHTQLAAASDSLMFSLSLQRHQTHWAYFDRYRGTISLTSSHDATNIHATAEAAWVCQRNKNQIKTAKASQLELGRIRCEFETPGICISQSVCPYFLLIQAVGQILSSITWS
jgi:hypothetical protein